MGSLSAPDTAADEDVLVVGFTDHAVEVASALADAGAGVVLAAGGMGPTKLSPAGDNWLRRLGRERRATLLYRSLPDEVSEVARYTLADRERLLVTPGLTCIWQVSGRNEISFEQWMYMDLQYIDTWSFTKDVSLILKTFPVVLTGRGAS